MHWWHLVLSKTVGFCRTWVQWHKTQTSIFHIDIFLTGSWKAIALVFLDCMKSSQSWVLLYGFAHVFQGGRKYISSMNHTTLCKSRPIMMWLAQRNFIVVDTALLEGSLSCWIFCGIALKSFLPRCGAFIQVQTSQAWFMPMRLCLNMSSICRAWSRNVWASNQISPILSLMQGRKFSNLDTERWNFAFKQNSYPKGVPEGLTHSVWFQQHHRFKPKAGEHYWPSVGDFMGLFVKLFPCALALQFTHAVSAFVFIAC